MGLLPIDADILPPCDDRVFKLLLTAPDAKELLMSISQDERECAIFRSRRKFQADYQSDLATARDNGIQIGRAEGRIEIARNLMKLGLSHDQIVTATGLTIHDIEHLCTEL